MFINKDLYQKTNSDLKVGQDILCEYESYSMFTFSMTGSDSSTVERATITQVLKLNNMTAIQKALKQAGHTYRVSEIKTLFKEAAEVAIYEMMNDKPEVEPTKNFAARNKKTGYWYGRGTQGSLLVRKPVVKITWDKVCLAKDKKKAIFDALSQVKYSKLIFDTWGFASTIEKGRALTFLFYGLPGTGKTLTAQAIADFLDFDLLTITPTDLNDKYFGETEKRIREVFRKADSRTVILFDECDGLVMDRAKGSNIVVPHINQFIYDLEHFDGVCVFTTNNIDFLDKALERRLALKVEFENPDAKTREMIWRKLIPDQCPLDLDVDFKFLSKFPVNGGHIKNIVLNAARSAARDRAKRISMKYFVEAIEFENNGIKGFNKIQST